MPIRLIKKQPLPKIIQPKEPLAWQVRLLVRARRNGNWWNKFLARRVQSNWKNLHKIPFVQSFLRKPSKLAFSSGNSFHFDSLDSTFRAYYAPRLNGVMEPEISILANLILPENGVFFDVGCNWGVHTFTMAQSPTFKGQIYAFEANKETAQTAQNINKELNLPNPPTINAFGLSDSNRKTTIGGFGRTGDSSTCQVDTPGGIPTELKVLDNLNLPAPHLIKIDVEGHELEVLHGAEEILKTMPFILFESWGTKIDADIDQTFPVLKLLEKKSYTLFRTGWAETANGDINEEPNPKATEHYLILEEITAIGRAKHRQLINILAVPNKNVVNFTQMFNAGEK